MHWIISYDAGVNPALAGSPRSVGDDNIDKIIDSYYNPEYAIPYIRQPSNEEMEIESENLFKNVITLIRLAIAVDSDHDYLKRPERWVQEYKIII